MGLQRVGFAALTVGGLFWGCSGSARNYNDPNALGGAGIGGVGHGGSSNGGTSASVNGGNSSSSGGASTSSNGGKLLGASGGEQNSNGGDTDTPNDAGAAGQNGTGGALNATDGAGGSGGEPGCDASSCLDGCCDGDTCVPYASESNAQCGTGGEQCAKCPTGVACNLDGGICLGCSAATTYSTNEGSFLGSANDRFGDTVSVGGGNLFVVAPNAYSGVGAVLSFAGSGTSWTSSGLVGPKMSSYVSSAAVRGATAVVSGNLNGATMDWVFSKTGANWFQQGDGVAVPGTALRAVALDGSTFVASGVYSATVYSTSGGDGVALTPNDFTPANSDAFGTLVAVSGNTVLVSGLPSDAQGQPAHFAYVFVKSGASWVQQGKLVPDDLMSNSAPHFYFSLALDGDTAVLATTFGAYVFQRSGTSWTQIQKITPPASNSNFGYSVALSGNLLVVGAADVFGNHGATYVYGRSNDTFMLGPTLRPTNANPPDEFGASVGVSAGAVVVGAPATAIGDNSGQGMIYTYACSPQ